MKYLVVIEKGSASYGAYVPDLPGCVAVGESRIEVTRLIHEAIQFHLEEMQEDGLPTKCRKTACQFRNLTRLVRSLRRASDLAACTVVTGGWCMRLWWFRGGAGVEMIDWSRCTVVERTPERLSGAWVFRGTRVPVAALFENLEDNATVHEFVNWFPGGSLEQARGVLAHAARSSLAVT